MDNKVCNDVVIVFSNLSERVFITAPVDEKGAYQVQMAEGFGLPLGIYEVSIRPAPPKNWDRPPIVPPIPPKYRDGKTSGLTLEVEPGQNVFNVAMTSRN